MHIAAILRFLVELAAPFRPPEGHVVVSAGVTASPGETVELSVTILDAPISDMPIELRLHAASFKLEENRFGNDDIVDPLATQPRLSIRFTAPPQPGHHTVLGELTYVTCRGRVCQTRRARPSWTFEVRGP